MFDIYIKDFNQNGQIITTETLVQTVPSLKEGDLKLIGPVVKNEMGNAESFNFSIQSGTKFYDAFNQMKTFIRVVYDGNTIFFGRVLTIDNGFYGDRKIRCEGPIAFFNDSSVEGVAENQRSNISSDEYLDALIANHNTMVNDARRSFYLGEVPGRYSSEVSNDQRIPTKTRKYGSDGWTDTKNAIEDLRSHFGGYFRVRCPGYKNDSNNTFIVPENKYNILDWMDGYFNKNAINQKIEVGKNVIDISTTTEVDNIFTVVIPIGNTKTSGSETIDGEKQSNGPKHFYVPGKEVTVPSICEKYGSALNFGYHTYSDYANALNKYGRIIKTVVFDDANNSQELLEKCQEWIKNNYQGEVTKFTVKAVDMHQIGDKSISKIAVGDRVEIVYPLFKEDGSVVKTSIVRTCLSISYDLYNPENNAYTFGIPANSLTKSYGVTKQGKKTTDPSSKPKYSGGGGNSGESSWIEKVRNWLMKHKVFYYHNTDNTVDPRAAANYPYPGDNYRDYMKGPYFYSQPEGGSITGERRIWKFKPLGLSPEYDQNRVLEIQTAIARGMVGRSDKDILAAQNEAIKEYENSLIQTQNQSWSRTELTIEGILTHEIILECNIIQYVKSEYGIDLTSFEGVKMPKITYTDPNTGVTKTVEPKENAKLVTTEMFKPDYELGEGYHLFTAPDGSSVISVLVDGKYRYYTPDPDNPGKVIESEIFNINKRLLDTETSWGNAYDKYFYNPETGEMELVALEFSQSIESYAGGPLVVAKVEGDVVTLGGNHASQVIVSALKNISQVCGSYTVSIDPITGARKVYVKDGTALLQQKEGLELGYFHDGNLTGGVIVNKINETGETEAKISADQVRIEGRTFVEAGIVSGHYRKVDLSRYPDDVNPQAQGWYNINDKGEYFLTGDTSIVPSHEYFEINPREGMVTGELLIQHINDDETEAKLTADQIRINGRTFFQAGLVEDDYLEVTLYGGEDPAEEGLYEYDKVNKKYVLTGDHSVYPGKHYYRKNPNGGMLTAGILVDKINDQNVTFIRGDKVVIGDTASEESVMSALMTSGVVTSSKVNLNEWPSNVNPQKQGWYSINNAGEYFLTGDTEVIDGHEYFYAPHNGKTSRALVANSIYTKEINAINGHFSTIEAQYLKVSELNAEIGKISSRVYIGTRNDNTTGLQIRSGAGLDLTGVNITFTDAHLYGKNTSIPGYSANSMIVKAAVDANSNVTLTQLDGNTVTFTSAVTLNKRAWSNGIYTPSAAKGKILNPIDGMTKIGSIVAPIMIDDPDHPGQKKYNDPWVTGTYTVHRYFDVYHTWLNDKDEWESANTGFRTEVSITASDVYTSGKTTGWSEAYNKKNDDGWGLSTGFVKPAKDSDVTTTVKIVGPSSVYNATANYTCTLMADYNNPNNAVVACTGSGQNQVVYARITHGKYNAGWDAAYGIKDSDGWGLSTGYVKPAKDSDATTTVKIVGPSSVRNATANYTCTLMADYNNPNNAVVACTGSGQNQIVYARITHGKYDAGWDAAYGIKDSDGWGLSTGFVKPAKDSDITTTVKIVGPSSVRNATANYTCTLMADYNNPNNAVVACTGSGQNQVVYARITHGKYNAGWDAAYGIKDSDGWGLSTGFVKPAKDSDATTTVKIVGPSSVRNATANYTCTLMADYNNPNNAVVACTGSGQNQIVYARITHGKYDAGKRTGWSEAYYKKDADGFSWASGGGFVIPAADKVNQYLYVAGPGLSYNTSERHSCELMIDSDDPNNSVIIGVGSGSNRKVYARKTHGKYDDGKRTGWSEAYYKKDDDGFSLASGGFVIPEADKVNQYLRVAGPGLSYNTSERHSCELMIDSDDPNNSVIIGVGSGSNRKVYARKTHGKYDAGWKAAADNFVPTYYPSPESVRYFDLKYPTSSPDDVEEVRYWLVEDSTSHKVICYLGNKSGGTTAPVAGLGYTVPVPSASNIDIGSTLNVDMYWMSQAEYDSLPASDSRKSSTALNNIGAQIKSHSSTRGFVIFKATINGGTGAKWYRLATGN